MSIYGRTDLAAEAHSLWQTQAADSERLEGVTVCEETLRGFAVTDVRILNETGAALLGKASGRYLRLALPEVLLCADPAFESAVLALADLIRRCLPDRLRTVLIAALGNPDVTPDALGPLCAQSVLITRHLAREPVFQNMRSTALCRTGVLGTTGLESAFQLRALCEALHPDCVLAVDALAGTEPESLCRCVQVSDAGIAPGSGVGNDRVVLSRASLGIPVVALGVPTVIDAAALSPDAALGSFFVTPRYIDSAVRRCARLLGYAINTALHKGLSLSDMRLLLE
jgi:spore protease